MMLLRSFLCVIAAAVSVPAFGQDADDSQERLPSIKTRTIEYEHNGVTFRGYLAQPASTGDDDDNDDDRPGILVIHEWWGLNDFARKQTRRLAELGYVAFAADMYGEGRTTDDPQQAGQWAGRVQGNRELLRDQADAALEVLEDIDNVDDDRLGVIGFCFGGTVAVELGYDEDDVDAVVSFHGNPMPALEDDDDIEASFLILHGTADTLVPEARLKAFASALDRRNAQHRIIRYDGAKHAFMNPAADDLAMEGVGYDAQAARQAWADMQAFFNEVFTSEDD